MADEMEVYSGLVTYLVAIQVTVKEALDDDDDNLPIPTSTYCSSIGCTYKVSFIHSTFTLATSDSG